jgi:hypothetical protein
VRLASQAISELVLVHGEAHSAVARTVGAAVAALRRLHEEVKRTVREVGQEAARVHQGVAAGRRRLDAAFKEHQETCEVGRCWLGAGGCWGGACRGGAAGVGLVAVGVGLLLGLLLRCRWG